MWLAHQAAVRALNWSYGVLQDATALRLVSQAGLAGFQCRVSWSRGHSIATAWQNSRYYVKNAGYIRVSALTFRCSVMLRHADARVFTCLGNRPAGSTNQVQPSETNAEYRSRSACVQALGQ